MAGGADKAKGRVHRTCRDVSLPRHRRRSGLVPTNILRLKSPSLVNEAGPINEARPEARAEGSRILVVGTRLAEKGRGE